jgi:hypothetical protein
MEMEMEMENKLRDFGVFTALSVFPIFLVVFGVIMAIQRVSDFVAGFIPLFPANLADGGGFVLSLIGCVLMIAIGVYVFWAAFPVYKEHLNND